MINLFKSTMEEDCEQVVELVAVAAKLIEESKKAEAHARASKAYARKVSKEAQNGVKSEWRLLQMAKSMLTGVLVKVGLEPNAISHDELKRVFYLGGLPLTYGAIKTVLQLPSADDVNEINQILDGITSKLSFDDYQMECALDILDNDKRLEEKQISFEPMEYKNESSSGNFISNEQIQKLPDIASLRLSGAVSLQSSPGNVATKRKSRKRKPSAVANTSPLVSKEDITIFKRSTSPSPSISSQGYYVPVQHIFTVQRNRSSTSQKTVHSFTDDESESCPSPDKE